MKFDINSLKETFKGIYLTLDNMEEVLGSAVVQYDLALLRTLPEVVQEVMANNKAVRFIPAGEDTITKELGGIKGKVLLDMTMNGWVPTLVKVSEFKTKTGVGYMIDRDSSFDGSFVLVQEGDPIADILDIDYYKMMSELGFDNYEELIKIIREEVNNNLIK